MFATQHSKHSQYIVFEILKLRLRGHKEKKLNDLVYSCHLFVFPKHHHEAEF